MWNRLINSSRNIYNDGRTVLTGMTERVRNTIRPHVETLRERFFPQPPPQPSPQPSPPPPQLRRIPVVELIAEFKEGLDYAMQLFVNKETNHSVVEYARALNTELDFYIKNFIEKYDAQPNQITVIDIRGITGNGASFFNTVFVKNYSSSLI